MQVLFESRDPLAAPFRELAVHRVRFAMRRLAWLVPRAKVQLSDTNGPRGGVDKCCRVELSLASGGPVVITAVARNWRSAIDNAIGRAARAVASALRRRQQHDLRRHPAIGLNH